jgi:Zn-dependent protease with chaperone function
VEKSAVLQSLPADGALTQLGSGEQRKLRAVDAVLRTHRRNGVYDVRVIAVPQAWTGLHARAVLLISLPALTLLTSEELQALVAHEIGHEYVWQQYTDAKSRKDAKRVRELELVCDAIALRTLAREGVSPERLQTATEKVSWYNRERLGVALDLRNYPSLKERRQLIKKMSLLER